jgi:dihydroorotate dehydrogenase (NAD+) catalytic subunit
VRVIVARTRPAAGAENETGVDLRTRVGNVELANPVMTASGTAGHGAELSAYIDLSALGAVVVKSVSATPWPGNPAPRLLPLGAAGMLNSVGLQNRGVEDWLSGELPALTDAGATVVASIWGFSAADYLRVAAAIARTAAPAGPIVAVEANISCPNIEDSRNMFAHSERGVRNAVEAAVSGLSGTLPLWAKLSPNVTDLPSMAVAAVDAGAAAVTVINTVMGMAIDPLSGVMRLGGGGGGLSGPAVHPVAVRAVYECRDALPSVPIVGVGGVASGIDAAELIAAGADAVQVGTATFANPRAPINVLEELTSWCAEHGISSINELKGRAHDRH